MNITLFNNDSSSDDKSKNSNVDKGVNYMVFAFVIKSDLVEENERDEDIEQFDL